MPKHTSATTLAQAAHFASLLPSLLRRALLVTGLALWLPLTSLAPVAMRASTATPVVRASSVSSTVFVPQPWGCGGLPLPC